MRIHLTQHTSANTDAALAAAESWMQTEDIGIAPERGKSAEGNPFLRLLQLQDGIQITTTVEAKPVHDGTRVHFTIRMSGTSLGSRIRNVGLLPATRTVRRATKAQLQQMLAELPST